MDTSFSPVLAVVDLMRGFPRPWFVAGGWANDLFLGRVTRGHADIEIGIYRRDQMAVWGYLTGWSFEKAEGGEWIRWEKGEELRPPVHQIRAQHLVGEPKEFEFLLNERSEANWISRRHAGLERPIEEVTIFGNGNVPILMPEIQLLYKAKQTRGKDRADFELTLPLLTSSQRKWLADALRRYHPEHEWLKAIEHDD